MLWNQIALLLSAKSRGKRMYIIRGMIPAKMHAIIYFFYHYHRMINFKNPSLLDEKMLITQLQYNDNPLCGMCTDKYAVRDYLKEMGFGELLNEIYGAYDRAEDIPWDMLPEKYVIKCNHSSGYNLFVTDSRQLDRDATTKQLNEWMKDNVSCYGPERHGRFIKPKLIVERYLTVETGEVPPDYKFFVSYGKVLGCMIATGRGIKLERIFVDCQFEDTNFIQEYTGENYKVLEPANYDKMVEVAGQLGKDFPLVRVDLYNVDEKILFGELTFTSNGCWNPQFTMEGQKKLGAQIQL